MKSEFALAFNEIADRSKLKREVILEALETAMVQAYRKAVSASTAQQVLAKVDPDTGSVSVFAEKEVVEGVQDQRTEVELHEARKVAPEAALGDTVVVESTPTDFGRIAAQTAKQVILQRIREAEREAQYQEFADREGDVVNGTVQSVTGSAVTISLGRAEASLPRNQQVPGERYHAHDKIRAYVLEVRKTSRGPQIIVSRQHKNMLRRLLEYEVPEIYNGLVEIKSIAREAGRRSKVAVSALQEGVDPVGACVGMRGVRIQSIVRELKDEKIDIIEWNPDQSVFISKALSPARVSGVYLNDDPEGGRTALVVVPDDQLSLAIGREGQNARLAAKLTGWRIDIKSLNEAANEAMRRLREEPALAEMADRLKDEMQQAEVTLARRAENRPVAPEEFALLARLVDRVEREEIKRREAVRETRARRRAEIRSRIPEGAFKMPLSEAGLSARVFNLLEEAGYDTVGNVLEQLGLDEDAILGLPNFGPKALEETKETLAGLTYPEAEAEAEELAAAPELAVTETDGSERPAEAPAALAAEVVTSEVAETEAPVLEAGAPEVIEAEEGLSSSAVLREGSAESLLPAAVTPASLPTVVEEPETPEVEEAEEEPLPPEVTMERFLEAGVPVEEEEEEPLATGSRGKKKKKKGKRKQVLLEYDPDRGVVVTKRKHKRGGKELWEEPEP